MATDINFDRLERELEQAIDADRRYWERNDAKFRAVNQRVASYDEFKEIVNASHLKPLAKGERVADMRAKDTSGAGVWNRGAAGGGIGSRATGTESAAAAPSATPSEPPASCQQFLRHWRTLKTPEAQSGYLLSLPPGLYATVFAADVPFGLLGQFVAAFDACPATDDQSAGHVTGILGALARCQRFRLAVEFFSPEERLAAGRLFDRLGAGAAADAGDDLAKLRGLYVPAS